MAKITKRETTLVVRKNPNGKCQTKFSHLQAGLLNDLGNPRSGDHAQARKSKCISAGEFDAPDWKLKQNQYVVME
jgi:hypothetical protein